MGVRLFGLLIFLYPVVSYEYNKRPPTLRYVYPNGTYNDTKQDASRMYLFPTNPESHVINASIELLSSQQKHLQNVTEEFDLIDRRTNLHELKKMDAALFSLQVVLGSEIKKLQTKLKNVDDLSSEEKIDPIDEVSMVCLLSSWTQMLNIIEKIKKDQHKIKGVEEQIEDMKRTIDIAAVELRLYEHIQEQRIERRENATKAQEE